MQTAVIVTIVILILALGLGLGLGLGLTSSAKPSFSQTPVPTPPTPPPYVPTAHNFNSPNFHSVGTIDVIASFKKVECSAVSADNSVVAIGTFTDNPSSPEENHPAVLLYRYVVGTSPPQYLFSSSFILNDQNDQTFGAMTLRADNTSDISGTIAVSLLSTENTGIVYTLRWANYVNMNLEYVIHGPFPNNTGNEFGRYLVIDTNFTLFVSTVSQLSKTGTIQAYSKGTQVYEISPGNLTTDEASTWGAVFQMSGPHVLLSYGEEVWAMTATAAGVYDIVQKLQQPLMGPYVSVSDNMQVMTVGSPKRGGVYLYIKVPSDFSSDAWIYRGFFTPSNAGTYQNLGSYARVTSGGQAVVLGSTLGGSVLVNIDSKPDGTGGFQITQVQTFTYSALMSNLNVNSVNTGEMIMQDTGKTELYIVQMENIEDT